MYVIEGSKSGEDSKMVSQYELMNLSRGPVDINDPKVAAASAKAKKDGFESKAYLGGSKEKFPGIACFPTPTLYRCFYYFHVCSAVFSCFPYMFGNFVPSVSLNIWQR